MEQDIEAFVAKRDEVLASKDEAKIRAFFKENNGYDMPDDERIFWVTVHKAITASRGLPLETRRQSKLWLFERGFKSFDDGDL